jgi:DNA polymerase-3 subunit delta'
MSLVYNEKTCALLDAIREKLPQGLLLHGDSGVGLLSAARELAGDKLAGVIGPTDAHDTADPHGTIRAKQIRSLYDETKGKSRKELVYIIDNADQMNHVAQNAFLKLLEEPAPHIHFILTAHRQHQLLPTILSRVEKLRISPLSEQQSAELIRSLGVSDTTKVQQLKFLAGGMPAELSRLAQDESYFAERAQVMADARTFISASKFDRSVVAHHYASDRDKALLLLSSASIIIRRTIRTKPSYELIELGSKLADAYDAIARNGNVRLQLIATVV